MPRTMPCLWFDKDAEEAARFYASVFRDARMGAVVKAPAGGEPYVREGQVITAEVVIGGVPFTCLNGGPHADAKPNDAVSFQIICEDQAEVDECWTKLTADGGRPVQCGWLKDRWGFAWQIVPEILPRLMYGADRAVARRVAETMMKMVKIDIAAIEAAARG